MNVEILEDPKPELIDFLDQKIADFNWAHWEVSERKHIAVQITDNDGNILAGAAGRSFGNWLLINTLWVSEELRGQQVGSEVLEAIESAGRARGCNQCLLDTLNFQAMPFYKKHGYETQWVQENYPKTGCKYFMVKQL